MKIKKLKFLITMTDGNYYKYEGEVENKDSYGHSLRDYIDDFVGAGVPMVKVYTDAEPEMVYVARKHIVSVQPAQ